MKFEFTDKASYLAWRAEWKADYKSLSDKLRRLKLARKQYLRSYETTTTSLGNPPKLFKVRNLISKTANPSYDEDAAYAVRTLQAHATYEMERLKEAKELAWNLKQASQKATAAD